MSGGRKIQVLSQSWFLTGSGGLLKLTGQQDIKTPLAWLVSATISFLSFSPCKVSAERLLLLSSLCISWLLFHLSPPLLHPLLFANYKNEWADFMDTLIDYSFLRRSLSLYYWNQYILVHSYINSLSMRLAQNWQILHTSPRNTESTARPQLELQCLCLWSRLCGQREAERV